MPAKYFFSLPLSQTRRPLSFATACSLSLIAHAVLFSAFAILFSSAPSPHAGPAPVQLEYDFVLARNALPEAAPTQPLPQRENIASPARAPQIARATTPTTHKPLRDALAEAALPAIESMSAMLPAHVEREITRAHAPLPALARASLPLAHKEQQALARALSRFTNHAAFLSQRDTIFHFSNGATNYTAQVRHAPHTSATGIAEAEVLLTTAINGQQWQSTLRLQRLAFSHFAQFIDYWDPHVAIHADELEGRFHTNSGFTISNSNGVHPKFLGKVSTAGYDVRAETHWGVAADKEIFREGLETGAREIPMPKQFSALLQNDERADSLSQRFEEETWIVFHADGSYSWQRAQQAEAQRRRLPHAPFLIWGGKKAELHVRGVLAGQVLVQSEKKIIIEDDLTYAHDPEARVNAEDFLGLVCRRDIVVAAPQSTGPGDLYIYAAIFAGGRFEVTHLYGAPPATLHIYGSLSAGSLSATEPRYATRVRFDKRFAQNRPPYFPMTDRYEISDWQPEWKMVMPNGREEEKKN